MTDVDDDDAMTELTHDLRQISEGDRVRVTTDEDAAFTGVVGGYYASPRSDEEVSVVMRVDPDGYAGLPLTGGGVVIMVRYDPVREQWSHDCSQSVESATEGELVDGDVVPGIDHGGGLEWHGKTEHADLGGVEEVEVV